MFIMGGGLLHLNEIQPATSPNIHSWLSAIRERCRGLSDVASPGAGGTDEAALALIAILPGDHVGQSQKLLTLQRTNVPESGKNLGANEPPMLPAFTGPQSWTWSKAWASVRL